MHLSARFGAALSAVCASILTIGCGTASPPSPPDAGEVDAGHIAPDAGLPPPVTGPEKLSETGLYGDFATRALAEGVITYTPRFELWSDGAEKVRYLLLPEGRPIDTSDMDNWVFPVGTKSWKELKVDGRPVETRILWKVREGPKGWFQMAYLWNADGTEAFASPDGQVDANGTTHDVPAQAGCPSCHDGVRDVLISPSALQLSRPGGEGPLSEWARAGRLSHPPSSEFDPPGTGNVQAALGYLHANCGNCHRDGNALATKRKLRLDLKTSDVQAGQTGAYLTAIKVKAWHEFEGTTQLVVPGEPEASQLFRRMEIRDALSVHEAFGYQMPPTCTEEPDVEGLALIRAWIEQL